MIPAFIYEEENQLKNIFNRLKKKDFSGNTGQAIKNSSFQLATNLIAKIGSLLFIVLLARLLMPELFGLYSLALSTIVIFATFSDLGIGNTLITFVSKNLGIKNEMKAKAYFSQLFKWKLLLTLIVSLLLLSLSYFIANFYYNKPIFYALLAGVIYIPLSTLVGILTNLFMSANLFRYPFYKEILFQTLRFIFVPLGALLLLHFSITDQSFIGAIILILSFCYAISLIFLFGLSKKKLSFLKQKRSSLTNQEKKDLFIFLWPLTAMVLSGIFFGYIDTIMLGHFVEEGSFIAYYSAAFSLIGAAVTIISFTGNAVLPIFARLKGKLLEGNFRKIRIITLFIGIVAAIFTYFISKYLILLIYGSAYENSILILQIFSTLLVITPLATLYNNYFISQGRTKILAILLVSTTLLNIVLNYYFITSGLQISMYSAVLGACTATIISRFVHLLCLGFAKRLIIK